MRLTPAHLPVARVHRLLAAGRSLATAVVPVAALAAVACTTGGGFP